jgi:site-specific recombinase XerD
MQTLNITSIPLGTKQKITLSIPEPQSAAEEQLQKYIIDSLSSKMPAILPFTFNNQSTMELAKYLLRYRTGSQGTLLQYLYDVYRFCNWLNNQPDQMIKDCKDQDGDPNPKAIAKYNKLLDDYVGELQAQDITPGGVTGFIKGVKSLFRCNGIRLELKYSLPNRIVYRDRAPTPEELQKILDIAALRERVIVSMFAFGGFREGTLTKLKYRHVKRDLESGIIPLHIHVEAEITKGKYHDYDTFLGQEAVDYLRLYLQLRRKGTKCIPPENIHDESPLIRNMRVRRPAPITTTAVYTVVHKLYQKAGLISDQPLGRRYEICVHSIRKFFRTQLASLNIQTDYIEYMMGHTISTYHDIQMKGIEYLRGIYATSGLSIKPKTRISKIDALKEIIRAWGLNPEEILTRDALTKPNATVIGSDQREERQLQQLSIALKQQLLKEVREEKNEETNQ